MSSKPNDNTPEIFNTRNVFGQLAAPDSTPTAVLYRNGVIDGAVTVTVAQLTTTRFSATYTIPGTYSAGDTLQVIVSWTMGGAADELPLPIYVIDSARIYDITAGTGSVKINLTEPLTENDTSETVGGALKGAWTAGLGKIVIASDFSTLSVCQSDGTVLKTFSLTALGRS
jgi:hypothetical protein